MANAVTTLNNLPPPLSAENQRFFEEEANITPKQTVPSLSYEGKVWTISLNGEKTKLMARDPTTGDESPVPVFRCVILAYNPRRGRAYYEGAYDPKQTAMPACWSDDGITPSRHVKEKQSDKCNTCPLSVRGSKVTEKGELVTACSEHRMIVLVPSGKLDYEPLRMKIAITSDWDGRSPDHQAQGWFGFKNYTDFLYSLGAEHTARIVTKMKFDPNVAWPKVLFAKDRWLTDEQISQIKPVVKSEKVKQLISGTWTPNGIDGEPIEEAETTAELTTTAATAKPTAPPPKEPTEKEKKVAAAKIAATAAAKALAEAEADEDGQQVRPVADDEGGEIMLPEPGSAAAKGVAAAARAAATKSGNGATKDAGKAAGVSGSTTSPMPPEGQLADLQDLLKEWG